MVPVPTVKEQKDFEYLLWVGSMGSYDNRSQKVTRALVQPAAPCGGQFRHPRQKGEKLRGHGPAYGERVPVPAIGDGQHRTV